jgi:hypothetical protein
MLTPLPRLSRFRLTYLATRGPRIGSGGPWVRLEPVMIAMLRPETVDICRPATKIVVTSDRLRRPIIDSMMRYFLT